ncbi:hypothetical protein COB64_04660 [Candidatus Wolfebacteria bacterium]|nr:MAG: hypothetical protein COB64_04660 [Candidatus Wolfebacteria bacterium]
MKLINLNDDFKQRFGVIHEKIGDEIGLKILTHPDSIRLFQCMIEHDSEYKKFREEPFNFEEKKEFELAASYAIYADHTNGFCIGSQLEVSTETLNGALVELFLDLNYSIKEFRHWEVEKKSPRGEVFDHKAIMFYAFLVGEHHFLRMIVYKGSIYKHEIEEISKDGKLGKAEVCSLLAFDIETYLEKSYL